MFTCSVWQHYAGYSAAEYGGTVMGSYTIFTDSGCDLAPALLKQWGVPEKYRGIGCCILGYTAEEPAPKPRLDGRIWKI